MPLPDEPPSTPNASTSSEDAIAYYKAQYEQLESELADFQTSSRELEAELEKDIDASEKRERRLREKVESIGYEAEEWKTKYKQAKTEANSAQNTLQKEVTTLRDSNRTLQLKLRDIEVANDDFERQARNTTSSLEDLESKYNVSIERGVLLEEEIKNGEQERETLRIDAQRLRDELSDLKVEAHILEEKLRKADSMSMGSLRLAPMDRGSQISHSMDNLSHSPATTTSSPTIATPPTKSTSSIASEAATPPSPPFSESSTSFSKSISTPGIPRPRVSISESSTTLPKVSQQIRSSRHSRGPSFQARSGRNTPSVGARRGAPPSTLPKSGSLYQIRGLIGKMQKLEERVQSARSRLPAPVETPPRVSPRTGSAMGQNFIPSTVTVRSRKRSSGSSIASSRDRDSTPSRIPQGRGSFGLPVSTPSRTGNGDSRPSSRTSMSSRCSVNHSSSNGIAQPRPDSRQSLPGSRTPLGHYSSSSMNENRRPRSSLSNFNPSFNMAYIDEGDAEITTPTPRQSMGKNEFSSTAIPTPAGLKKRQSGSNTRMTTVPTPRRVGSSLERRGSGMLPPERKKPTAELGETY